MQTTELLNKEKTLQHRISELEELLHHEDADISAQLAASRTQEATLLHRIKELEDLVEDGQTERLRQTDVFRQTDTLRYRITELEELLEQGQTDLTKEELKVCLNVCMYVCM